MPYAICFRTTHPVDRRDGGTAGLTYVTRNTRGGPFGSPWIAGHHFRTDEGRSKMFVVEVEDAHLFTFKAEAAQALGDIVQRVWGGGLRWIDAPEIVELRTCDDCGFITSEGDVTRCPDAMCRGTVG